jgi:hypothetical protein
MPRRHISTRELLVGAALAGLAGVAWSRAKERPPEVVEQLETAAPAPPVVGTTEPRSRRRIPVGLLAAAVGLASLIVAGMAFSAAPSGSLEEPARPAVAPAKNRLAELVVASRHFYDVPANIVTPPRRPVLPEPRPSEQTVALARYAQVLGPAGMQAALESERSELSQRVLSDPRVHLYPGGRADLAADRVDPRVLALIEYLAEVHGNLTVSCLISGHSLYVHGRPGVVSAHIYGRAVDIAAVGGIPIAGNQQPGGITEQTIREILSLPDWLHPKQVISLLDLGGPSFPLPDHADHIHVGY